ncbi:uncharacterized protein LOC111706159 isoform X2 [Eurytemora carolleeae]|uniref:uncharacterized protein LOC111706159 isoform X2 n=1 Tax=Eurytemora carolleeae TaxID=1294199 RepID=UPI000C775796|nr:uncharacterized protein LOC111706159 isoform X2 [Eurytemora carolleeae]|eukprot:XP_023334715.1 uncharacterized protein LOC111706159 isoform X2 [Eurytemora affinis]
MNSIHIVVVVLAAVVTSCHAQCNDQQLNKAKLRFKDCLEDKKAHLLQLDYEEDNDMQLLICSGLKELSTGCQEAVNEFSFCMSREHVDHLVEIHINAISDVLAPFHPTLELRDCPVFNTPPPTIVHQKPEPEAAAAEYSVTGTGVWFYPGLLTIILSVFLL